MKEYRQAGRVGVLQKGLENDGEVIFEETVAEEQLLETFLCVERTCKQIFYGPSNDCVFILFYI